MEKTKHIHDMVVHQKPEQEPTNNRYYRERQRNQNYHPYSWRQNTSSRQVQQKSSRKYGDPIIIDNRKYQSQQNQQAVVNSDNNLSRGDSEGFVGNNIYYRDNCNYL